MLIATWSVAAPDFDVGSFLAKVKFTPDDVWRRGERPQWTTSGFAVQVKGDDEDSFESFLSRLKTALLKIKPVQATLREWNLSGTLSIGFTVPFKVKGKEFVTRSVTFPPEFLTLLTTMKLPLVISSYPKTIQGPAGRARVRRRVSRAA